LNSIMFIFDFMCSTAAFFFFPTLNNWDLAKCLFIGRKQLFYLRQFLPVAFRKIYNAHIKMKNCNKLRHNYILTHRSWWLLKNKTKP
jgi:hypothetical protein